MPGSTHFARAVCPYFIRDEKLGVCCEGLRDGATLAQRFESLGTQSEWMADYCESLQRWATCPLARALTEKYDSGEA